MAFNIGAIVSVNGEPEFNQAMRNMGQNLKYVNAEANSVMSTFGKNEKSVASLTARNGELRKALDIQRTGIKSIQTEMERLIAAGLDPTSEKYKQLKANLDNTTAAANKTEREIKDNEKAMTSLNKGGVGLGDTLNNLTSKLGVTLPDSAKESLNSMATLDANMMGVAAAAIAVGAAIYKAIDALSDLAIAQAEIADTLLTDSIISGIDPRTLQELKFAAGLVDTEVETITSSMTKLTRTMDSARKGTKETADAYRQLGIKITEGPHKSLRDSEEVFWETIDALRRVRNETERDALAMTLMGKSAKDLNPLIEAGSGKMKEYAKQAQETGYILNDEMLKTLGALDDQMMYFNNSTETAKNMIAVEFAPALTKFMEVGGEVFEALGKFAKDSGLVDIFASILEIVSSLGPAFETLAGVIGPLIGQVLKPLALALAVVADALNIIVSLIAIVVEGIKMLFGTGSSANVQRFWGNITGVFTGDSATARTFNNLYGNQVPRYATGTLNHPGGWALVGENGPELLNLPRGTGVENNNNTMRMLSGGGGDTFNVTIDAKNVREFNDIVKMAQSARQTRRAGGR